ncbi:MAG: T9SS type A sorting domain-containing protein [Bacteroidales bacterium]
MNNKKKYIFFMVFGLFIQSSLGQNRGLFSVAGAVTENDIFSFSWSVGEPLSGKISGVQAPVVGYMLNNIAVEKPNRGLSVKIYPTLFTTSITVCVFEEDLPLRAVLYAMDGRVCMQTDIKDIKQELLLPTLGSSFYILKIFNNRKQYSAKVIKQ